MQRTGKYLFNQQWPVPKGAVSTSFETESQTSSVLVNCYNRRWTPRSVLCSIVRLESFENKICSVITNKIFPFNEIFRKKFESHLR